MNSKKGIYKILYCVFQSTLERQLFCEIFEHLNMKVLSSRDACCPDLKIFFSREATDISGFVPNIENIINYYTCTVTPNGLQMVQHKHTIDWEYNKLSCDRKISCKCPRENLENLARIFVAGSSETDLCTHLSRNL